MIHSTLYKANRGHRERIAPPPRRASDATLLAYVRQLETAGALTTFEADRARARVGR